MATAQLITRDNFDTLMVRSTGERGNSPNGNWFIDLTNDEVQLITREELAQVDLGSGLEDNPLTNGEKIQQLAVYFAYLNAVQADAALQQYVTPVDAVGNRMARLVGANAYLNGDKLASGAVDAAGRGGSLGDDRLKIADSGFTEFAAGGGGNTLIDRIYHGSKSVNFVDPTAQPFYLLAASTSEADRQAATPVNYSRLGPVNDVVQTFGSTANGDTGAGDFDRLTYVLISCVREFGFTVGEAVSTDIGVTELGAYLQGYPLGHTQVPEIAALTESDICGTNEVQEINSDHTGGNFELTFDGQTTTATLDAAAATAADVQTALEALSNLEPGDVTVTGGPLTGTDIIVEFTGARRGADQPEMTVTDNGTGGTAVAVTTTTAGVAPVSPYANMAFFREASAQSVGGSEFAEGAGNFTDIIQNPDGGSLLQVRAWLDKLMQQDSDENANTGTTGSFRPKRAEPLYVMDGSTLVTRQGIFIENLPVADQQSVQFTADDGSSRTYTRCRAVLFVSPMPGNRTQAAISA